MSNDDDKGSKKIQLLNKCTIPNDGICNKNIFIDNIFKVISRDIKSSLNSIDGLISLVVEELDSTEKTGELIHLIKKNVKNINAITNDILEYIVINRNRIIFEDDIVVISDVLNNIIERNKKENIFKDITFRIKNPVDRDLISDKVRLDYLFNHILYLLLKKKVSDLIEINISITRETEDDVFLKFDFLNEQKGKKAADETQKKIESFEYLISEKMSILMNGSLKYFESEFSGRFILNLKLKKRKINSLSVRKDYFIGKQKKDRFNILVVDDIKLNHIIMGKLIRKLEHNYFGSLNGKDAIDVLSKENIDIIFMDIDMPGLSGFETTKLIRQGEAGEENREKIIVAYTAYSSKGDRHSFIQNSMNGYLPKPCGKEELSAFLRLIPNYKKGFINVTGIEEIEIPVFDEEDFYERLDNDKELIEVMIEDFKKNAFSEYIRLRELNEKRKIQELKRHTHNLKGLYANMSAKRLEILMEEIEELILKNNHKKIERLIEKTGCEIELLIKRMRTDRKRDRGR